MNAPNTDARVEHATAELLKVWQSGDLPAAVAKVFIRRQAGERPSDRWSLGKQLLCLLAGTDDARGFRQWRRPAGTSGRVRRRSGSSGPSPAR
ncbi:MAG: hypothetical protein ACRD0D_05105 [Acidimicrobiales bacterium]